MTTLFIASYVTLADFECLSDDGGYDSPWDMAQGAVAAAGMDRDIVVMRAKQVAREELLDREELTLDDEIEWHDEDGGFRGDVGVDPTVFLIIREIEAAQ